MTAEQPDRFGQRRVLLVEDEAMSRTLLRDVISAAGFEVRACSNAAEALSLVGTFDPDAVITDIDLGGGPTGLDLVVALHKMAPFVAIVILSNYAITPDYRREGLGRPVYVNKQGLDDLRILIDALDDALRDAQRGGDDGTAGRLGNLTPTQVQVLRMLAEGASNDEIARARATSLKSVENMITRIFAALGIAGDGSVNMRVAAARIYFEEAGLPHRSS